jgi:hypothetical protein
MLIYPTPDIIYSIGGEEHDLIKSAGQLLLIKASRSTLQHGDKRTDDKGRNWVFNGETRRWRIDRGNAPEQPKQTVRGKKKAAEEAIVQPKESLNSLPPKVKGKKQKPKAEPVPIAAQDAATFSAIAPTPPSPTAPKDAASFGLGNDLTPQGVHNRLAQVLKELNIDSDPTLFENTSVAAARNLDLGSKYVSPASNEAARLTTKVSTAQLIASLNKNPANPYKFRKLYTFVSNNLSPSGFGRTDSEVHQLSNIAAQQLQTIWNSADPKTKATIQEQIRDYGISKEPQLASLNNLMQLRKKNKSQAGEVTPSIKRMVR